MSARKAFLSWPVLRQLTGTDPLGRGAAVKSAHTSAQIARTETAGAGCDQSGAWRRRREF